MLQPDFDPAPTTVRIHRCKYVSQCKAHRCLKRTTTVAEKVDNAVATFGRSSCASVTVSVSSNVNKPGDSRSRDRRKDSPA